MTDPNRPQPPAVHAHDNAEYDRDRGVMPSVPLIRDSLSEAKDALFLSLSAGEGVQCPCCEQHARVWRRVLGSTIAGPLKDIHRRAEEQRAEYKVAGDDGPRTAVDVVIGYVDVRQFHYRGGDYSKSQFWNLLAPHPTRMNVFHLTELGIAFVEGRATVPRYVLIYNDGVIGFSEEHTDIATALRTAFNVDEMKASK